MSKIIDIKSVLRTKSAFIGTCVIVRLEYLVVLSELLLPIEMLVRISQLITRPNSTESILVN